MSLTLITGANGVDLSIESTFVPATISTCVSVNNAPEGTAVSTVRLLTFSESSTTPLLLAS